MKVREKFQNRKLYINPYTFKLTKESAEEFEQIADDYAIKFAEWYHSANNNEYHLYPNLNIGEHLKIFKKEKGL
jgi:hypothetical protein